MASASSGGSAPARRLSLFSTAALGVVVVSLGSNTLGIAGAFAQAPPRAVVALAERHAAEAYDAYQRHDYGRAVQLYQQAMAAAPGSGCSTRCFTLPAVSKNCARSIFGLSAKNFRHWFNATGWE